MPFLIPYHSLFLIILIIILVFITKVKYSYTYDYWFYYRAWSRCHVPGTARGLRGGTQVARTRAARWMALRHLECIMLPEV